MSNKDFNSWIELTKEIANSQPVKLPLVCPMCRNKSIDFQYVGDIETKVGYLDIWCNECLNGIHISRVIMPDNTNVLPFSTSNDVIIRRIPNFKQILP